MIDTVEPISIPEIRIKSVQVPLVTQTPISSPYEAARIVGDLILKDAAQECIVVLPLDTKNRPLGACVATAGSVNATIAHPRELLKAAITSNATSMMIMHCHPSGDPSPSTQDFDITARMEKLCGMVEIPLLDHLIVGCGTGKYYSFREDGHIKTALPHGLVADYSPLYTSDKQPTQSSEKKDPVKELVDGVKAYLSSDKYKEILDTFSKFHHYSYNNCILIASQKPTATQVASFTTWKSLGRFPKKGTGIKVVCPKPYKTKVEKEIIDPATGQKTLQETEVQRTAYGVGYVFDVADTTGKPLPEIEELEGAVDDHTLYEALAQITPLRVTVSYGDTRSRDTKGFYNPADGEIRVRDDMSALQTIKTLAHEVVHSRYHDPTKMSENDKKSFDKADLEAQAEGTAYCILRHYGLDTSDYSFAYVGGWVGNTERLERNLEKIKDYSTSMISDIDKQLKSMREHIGHTFKVRPAKEQVAAPTVPNRDSYNMHHKR